MSKSKTLKSDFFRIEWHKVLPSTNDLLKERAQLGERAGTVIVAEQQTKGRGRYDRHFYSPSKGLYFSVLLRPNGVKATDSGRYTAMAAVAVARSMEELGLLPEIKWVNDVMLGGKKVCGILSEGAVNAEGELDYVVIGIGINVVKPKGGFAPEIAGLATAMFDRGTKRKVKRVLYSVLNNLGELYDAPNEIVCAEYRMRALKKGREIEVIEGRCQGIATVLGITDDYKLVVLQDGNTYELDGGEVKIKL